MLTVLLSLYWTRDETIELREGQMQMWLEDLAEFDLDIIRGALVEWRRKPGQRRPAPGDIRAMCQEHQTARDANKHPRLQGPVEPDADTLKLWSGAEYHGDFRTPQQRRQAAIDAQEEKDRRAAAYRAGKLDEYDAIHWPDRLRQRQKADPTKLSNAAE